MNTFYNKIFNKKYLVIALLIIISIAYCFSIDNTLPGDSKLSVILADSLTQGNGLRDISDIRNPYVNGAAPLSIGILSLFMRYIRDIKLLKIIGIVNLLIVFIFIYFYFMRITFSNDKVKICLFILLISNSYLFEAAKEISTHLPFLFFYMVSLYFLILYDKEKIKKYLILAAVFSACAFLTRWVGLSVFVGTFLYLLIRKDIKHLLLFTAVFMLITCPWFFYTAYLHFSGKAAFLYFTLIMNPYDTVDSAFMVKIVSISIRFFRNLGGYFFRCIPTFLFGDYFKDVNLVCFNAITVFKMSVAFFPSLLILIGFLKSMKFSAVHFCIIVYWIVLGMFAEPDIHYIIPMVFYFYTWIYYALRNINIKRKLMAIIVLVFFSLNIFYINKYASKNINQFDEIASWILTNTNIDDVILDYKWFSPLYIYTGRKTVNLLDHEKVYTHSKYVYKEPEELINEYESIKYVLVFSKRKEKQFLSVKKMVEDNSDKFVRRYTNIKGTISIYEIVK